MPQLYMYSDIAGTYVFSQSMHMIDKVLLKDEEALKSSLLLEQGRFTDAEKGMLKKHKKGDFTLLGFRTEQMANARAVFDAMLCSKVNEALPNDKAALKRLKELNALATRDRIRNSVNEDILIMQAISSVKELEKIANMLAKRLREWYAYCLPEFSESIKDHEKFAEIISKKSKDALLKELRLKREQSMGADMKKKDVDQIMLLAAELSSVYRLKRGQEDYLERLMKEYCPNIQAVAGTLIAAKLLERAGSLKRLVGFPSSTIQVLGAEEAFFRHMTTGSRMPKHGYIVNHPLVAKADKSLKGRIARALADKIAIAAKVDYFKGKFIGDKLRKMVEAKLQANVDPKVRKKDRGMRKR